VGRRRRSRRKTSTSTRSGIPRNRASSFSMETIGASEACTSTPASRRRWCLAAYRRSGRSGLATARCCSRASFRTRRATPSSCRQARPLRSSSSGGLLTRRLAASHPTRSTWSTTPTSRGRPRCSFETTQAARTAGRSPSEAPAFDTLDGRRFVVVRPLKPPESRVVVIERWFEEFRRR
jgi:hypothetical protein